MKKIYTLVLISFSTLSFGQTIYTESMGSGVSGSSITVANYITGTAPATFQNGAPIVYTGTTLATLMRATSPSAIYSGASAGGNVFLNQTTNLGQFFQIDGINTSAFTSANLQMTFGLNTSAVTAMPILEYSVNGTTWTPIVFTPTGTGWTLVSIAGGILPASASLSLKFTHPSTVAVPNTSQFRVDDIRIFNFNPACTLMLGTPTTVCDAVTSGIDTYTATIPYTGGGTGTNVITPSSGTVAGDNPNTVAAGNILITGITEGTALTVGIVNGVCTYSAAVATAPECKIVNTLPYVESFPYAAGSAIGLTQMWSNVNSGDAISTTAGNLTYTGLTSSGNSILFAADGAEAFTPITTTTSGTVYYSYLLNVASMTGVTDASGGYISGLGSSTTNLGATLWTKRVDDTNFNVGIEVRTANLTNTTYTTTAYPTTQTLLVVVGYTFNAATALDDVVSLWINPVIGAAQPVATITDAHAATDMTDIRNFFLRQDSNTETPSLQIDELRIGTTWVDVTGPSLSIAQNEIAGFSMYPNPVSNGKLFFTSENNVEKSVAIYDLVGKQVVNQVVTNEVNVATLSAGVYVVKVTEEGKTATRKLVVR